MQASEWEFRNRFWLIGGIFWVGFALYAVDPVNVVQFFLDHTIGRDAPETETVVRVVFGAGAMLMLAAALIRTWAAAYLRAAVVQDPNLHAEKVVADGPYRHVRNPLYLGNILMAVSFAMMADRAGAGVIVLGMTVFCLRLIGIEEAKLVRDQGEGYLKYRESVPRLLFSIVPRLPAGELEPQWKQAFGGEIFVWGFFLGVLAFAITLKIWATWVLAGLGLAVHIVRGYVMVRKSKAVPEQ